MCFGSFCSAQFVGTMRRCLAKFARVCKTHFTIVLSLDASQAFARQIELFHCTKEWPRGFGWLAASQMDLQPQAARPKRTREIASDKACLSCWLEIIAPYLDRTGCCAAPCVPCGSKFNACHVSFLKFLQSDAYSKRGTSRSSAMMICKDCIRDLLGADLQMTQMTAARKARRSHEENRNSLPNFGLIKPHMRFPCMRAMEYT